MQYNHHVAAVDDVRREPLENIMLIPSASRKDHGMPQRHVCLALVMTPAL